MSTHRLLRNVFRSFFRNWAAFITLIISMNLVLNLIVVPLMRWVTRLILQANDIPYISYTNVGWLLTRRPWAVAELVGLGLVIVLLVFWQFSFLLLGIDGIRNNQERRLLPIMLTALKSLNQLRPGSFFLFIPYFIIVLPFSEFFLSSPLLAKIQIPTFIVEFLSQNFFYTVLLLVFGVAITYLALRLVQILPLMILTHLRGLEALRNSLVLTQGFTWAYLWRSGVIAGLGLALTSGMSFGLYELQLQLDKLANPLAFTGAVINMAIMAVWVQLVAAAVLVWFILMLLLFLEQEVTITPQRRQLNTALARPRGARRIAIALISIFLIGQGTFNVMYLQGALLSKPLAISHRGVDDGNGVQNTIPALIKTSREKPAYVEMDLHETKDHQFVVMHDENLENLTGVDKQPYQLTLKQMTQLTARENGHKAHVASFDAYLKAAETHHQKLLVEIKTTPHDTKDMLTRFIDKYETRLLADHDRIHSLDYHVITGLKKHAPKLYVSYILPYNFTFPETKANAYTMEETTLNDTFVEQAHDSKQDVFAWTVNEEDDMQSMMFLNVDGIITDNLHELQTTLKENFDHPSYASRLLIYAEQKSIQAGE